MNDDDYERRARAARLNRIALAIAGFFFLLLVLAAL